MLYQLIAETCVTLQVIGRVILCSTVVIVLMCLVQVTKTASEHNGGESEQDVDICGDKEEGR